MSNKKDGADKSHQIKIRGKCMNYHRAKDKIDRIIGFNRDIKSFRMNETREIVRFFISNKQKNFFLEIYHRSTNVFELSVCDTQKFNPYMNRYSFKSLKELCIKLSEYKNKFICESE
ncbi:MAG: hypothetical protein II984_01340 [Clostridia bacterium]|nr:hypothetical protein [Clostridia bacterium]